MHSGDTKKHIAAIVVPADGTFLRSCQDRSDDDRAGHGYALRKASLDVANAGQHAEGQKIDYNASGPRRSG